MKKILFALVLGAMLHQVGAQTTKEKIESAGTYYFLPMEKVRILVPLKNYPYEGSIDYDGLADMELYPNTEFDYEVGFDGEKVRKFAYVEDLDEQSLNHIHNFTFALINKEIDADLVKTLKGRINDEEPYFYVESGIRSRLVDGFILGHLKEYEELDRLSLVFEVFVSLNQRRPDKEYDKNIFFGSKRVTLTEDIDKSSIESPILTAYEEIKKDLQEKIKGSFVKIQEQADKKLKKKLSK